MINRATGEICFPDGLHILPHCPVDSIFSNPKDRQKIETHKLSLAGWKRHVLGLHFSEHGWFEVEALSADEDRIYVVFLAHRDASYKPNTREDAERRAFHEGVIVSDLAGQKEFEGVKSFAIWRPQPTRIGWSWFTAVKPTSRCGSMRTSPICAPMKERLKKAPDTSPPTQVPYGEF